MKPFMDHALCGFVIEENHFAKWLKGIPPGGDCFQAGG